MTPESDDELWSAIGDPSRRRVLDLLALDQDAVLGFDAEEPTR